MRGAVATVCPFLCLGWRVAQGLQWAGARTFWKHSMDLRSPPPSILSKYLLAARDPEV